MLHRTIDLHADPGHAARQAGRRPLRAARRGRALSSLRAPRAASGVRVAAAQRRDVRRLACRRTGLVDAPGGRHRAALSRRGRGKKRAPSAFASGASKRGAGRAGWAEPSKPDDRYETIIRRDSGNCRARVARGRKTRITNRRRSGRNRGCSLRSRGLRTGPWCLRAGLSIARLAHVVIPPAHPPAGYCQLLQGGRPGGRGFRRSTRASRLSAPPGAS